MQDYLENTSLGDLMRKSKNIPGINLGAEKSTPVRGEMNQ